MKEERRNKKDERRKRALKAAELMTSNNTYSQAALSSLFVHPASVLAHITHLLLLH
jgi:hypothetical protein